MRKNAFECLILGKKLTCVIFSGAFDGIIELNNENYCIMGNMLQNIFFLDSQQVKWLPGYHGNRKRMSGMTEKKFFNHFRKCLADLKITNGIQK